MNIGCHTRVRDGDRPTDTFRNEVFSVSSQIANDAMQVCYIMFHSYTQNYVEMVYSRILGVWVVGCLVVVACLVVGWFDVVGRCVVGCLLVTAGWLVGLIVFVWWAVGCLVVFVGWLVGCVILRVGWSVGSYDVAESSATVAPIGVCVAFEGDVDCVVALNVEVPESVLVVSKPVMVSLVPRLAGEPPATLDAPAVRGCNVVPRAVSVWLEICGVVAELASPSVIPWFEPV